MKILIVRSKGAGVTRGAGEFARLRAVANLLAKPDDISIAEAHVISFSVLRPVIARCLRLPFVRRSIARRGVDHPFIRAFLKHKSIPDIDKPDLVLTTLGPRIVPGALIATMYGARWVHLGKVPRYWDYLYSCKVLSALRKETARPEKKTVRLDVLPTGARKVTTVPRQDNRLVATLAIGADVRHLGYKYTKEDYDILFKAIAEISAAHDIRWNITTSPRTPLEQESHIENLVLNLQIPTIMVTWYRRQPEKSLLKMLGDSNLAFITEDSRTMIADAVASGIPVFSLRPMDSNSIKPGHHNYVTYLEDKQFLKRRSFTTVRSLSNERDLTSGFHIIDQCWTEKLKHEIAPMLSAAAPLGS